MDNLAFKKGLFFLLFSVIIPFSVLAQKPASGKDSVVIYKNAALSNRYFNKFYSTLPNKPEGEKQFWEKTLILLNNDRILTKREFLQLNKNDILSIKTITTSGKSTTVDRVILIKTKH